MSTVIPLPPMEKTSFDLTQRLAPRDEERVTRLARRLASTIADAADADQYAVTIPGVIGPDNSQLEPLIPDGWLVALNGGKPAVHRLSIELRSNGHPLGRLQLSTLRPSGFTAAEMGRAQMDAYYAAQLLTAALGAATPTAPKTSSSLLHIEDFRASRPAGPVPATLAAYTA